MPDHIHLFVRFGIGCTTPLGVWIKGLKRDLSRVLLSTKSKPLRFAGQKLSSFWQPGFNDHLLRSDESYAEKWEYVFQNPCGALDLSLSLKAGRLPARSCESTERRL
jgi:hypothetical protein